MVFALVSILLLGSAITGCDSGQRGPLRVSKENPRYFTDDSGEAVYLTGSHTWNTLVEMNPSDHPDPFDWPGYLDFMKAHNHNFLRLWTWELLTYNTAANSPENPRLHHVSPHPWKRTGPGNAVDGKPKFDLSKFDEEYFERLRQRVIQAREKNIYVSIMLFEGWGIQFSPDGFKNHPFHPLNCINQIQLDTLNDRRMQIHELVNKEVLAFQEAYVKKVIETVNDLDNVLYEVSNENHAASTEWQYHIINFIKDYERTLDKQHPVGMTFQYEGGRNETLFNSPADWISPNHEGGYRDDPPVADGKKIILNDTDHLWGLGGNHQWVWKSFLRGMNPIFMDPYEGKVLNEGYEAKTLNAEAIRKNMGYTLAYARKMDLIRMNPFNELSSSGYCLVNPNVAYLIYLPGSNTVTADLTEANSVFEVEWFDPQTGQKTEGEQIKGGKKMRFDSPFPSNEAVLYLRRR